MTGSLARAAARRRIASGPRRLLRDTRPVVLDGTDGLRAVDQLRPYGDLAAARAHQRAVLHGVLDQGLQQQPRQERPARVAADLPVESEMARVTRLEDLRVAAQPFDLLVQRLHLAVGGHRIA